jgi:hypothetical protein
MSKRGQADEGWNDYIRCGLIYNSPQIVILPYNYSAHFF